MKGLGQNTTASTPVVDDSFASPSPNKLPMGQRFIVTTGVDHENRYRHWLWEYDLSKPRMPNAADERMHYACKGLIGVYHSREDATEAVRCLLESERP